MGGTAEPVSDDGGRGLGARGRSVLSTGWGPAQPTVLDIRRGPPPELMSDPSEAAAPAATPIEARPTKKPFSIAASTLGAYYDLHGCNRMLHRRAEPTRVPHVRSPESLDIESLAAHGLQDAHAQRGIDFEERICEMLARAGIPRRWEQRAGVDDVSAPMTDCCSFVSEETYDALASEEREGVGVLIDLKKKAEQGAAGRGGAAFHAAYAEASLAALRGEGSLRDGRLVPTILYQLMIKPPAALEPEHVTLSRGFLDYLQLVPSADGSEVVATVIDAKATHRIKLGAKVQISFYSLALAAILDEEEHGIAAARRRLGVPPLAIGRTGGVWLFERAAPVPFRLNELEAMLSSFLVERLPAILSERAHAAGHAAQEWELRSSCLSCSYLADCRAEARGLGQTSALSSVPRRRRLQLEAAVASSSPPAQQQPAGSRSLAALEAVAARPQPDSETRRLFSGSLLVRYDESHSPIELSPRPSAPALHPPAHSPVLAALRPGGGIQFNGRPSLTLPSSEDLALHLVVLEDPTRHRIYAWALGSQRRGGAPELDHSGCAPASAARCPEEAAESVYEAEEEALVKRLDETLQQAAAGGGTAALYFAERHEHASLVRLLMAGALRRVKPGAQAAHTERCLRCLLTFYHMPELVGAPVQPDPSLAAAQPGCVVPSYCVVLEEEARRLVSFPAAGPCTFGEVCTSLVPGWGAAAGAPPPTAEAIYSMWRGPEAGFSVEAGRAVLGRRLEVSAALLLALRSLAADDPQPTAALLPGCAPAQTRGQAAPLPMEPDLSKLAFLALFEAHTQRRALVSLRAAPLEQRLAARRGYTRLLRLDEIVGDPAAGAPVELRLQVRDRT